MLYSTFQELQDPNPRSSSSRIQDEGDTLLAEPEPTPEVATPYNRDETSGHREAKIEATPERGTDKSLRKNMFRAFDGIALITIGKTLQFFVPP
jgi:hypothetical protein